MKDTYAATCRQRWGIYRRGSLFDLDIIKINYISTQIPFLNSHTRVFSTIPVHFACAGRGMYTARYEPRAHRIAHTAGGGDGQAAEEYCLVLFRRAFALRHWNDEIEERSVQYRPRSFSRFGIVGSKIVYVRCTRWFFFIYIYLQRMRI